MKKILVAVLIAVLVLGTCLSLVAASPVLHILSDDDEQESEEENINAESVEPDEDDEDEETSDREEDENGGDRDEDDDGTEEEDEDAEELGDQAHEGSEDDDTDKAKEENENTNKDDDEDGVEDDTESREERELKIETSERTAKVESEIETEYMENKLEIHFKAEEGISIELKYENETETQEEEIEAELELEVRFLTMVEYIDNDQSGSLTEGDTTVQTVNLAKLEYSRPEVTAITSADNEPGYRFESVGTLNNFRFNITAVIFSTYALVDGAMVSPTETKITINITDFPFQNNTSAIALQINAVSEMEIEKETETTESEIEIKSENATGYFSWENWAIVDGVKAVNHSFTSYEEGTLINLCYPQGKSIIHDPKLGVGIKLLPVLEYVFTLITPELVVGTGIMALAITVVATGLSRGKKPLPVAGIMPSI